MPNTNFTYKGCYVSIEEIRNPNGTHYLICIDGSEEDEISFGLNSKTRRIDLKTHVIKEVKKVIDERSDKYTSFNDNDIPF